ncbi:MAG: ABC transporter ATP-binding protein [Elusimicrobiales bacterium]|nr:ABC transporter ATP-binding protein [Elusimicrobiales bacterium]
MLEIINLTKKFEKTIAVDNISLNIEKGEIFALLGPNGAGKTTTVKMIAGLLIPTSGKIYLNNIDVVKNPIEAKKSISYIPDEPFVYPNLTGREFLKFISEIYGIEDCDEQISELAEYFGLSEDIDRLLATYSHGMKQKILIASAIIRRPKLMIFDEPTVGLDPLSVRKFKLYLQKLKENGTSIFICTHILEMAEKICDKICVLNKGKIIFNDSVQNIHLYNNKTLEDVFFNLINT